ncbi:MAG: 6-carboxytetrahydropterin synthase [Gemmatimonadetes bacterium]|nr:6-carboxytetrahydropterin synthase [Gemmatimonadota bacterium]
MPERRLPGRSIESLTRAGHGGSLGEALLERTLRVRAVHHYARPGWSAERNRAAFGAVADPHPHEYAITVTVRGTLDEDGFVVDLVELDRLLAEIVSPLHESDLNERIPDVRAGRLQPSTEALARWLWERLEGRFPGPARLVRVRVAESAELAAEYPASAPFPA